MKNTALSGLAIVLLSQSFAFAHEPVTRARTPIRLPDVPGFVTLKCDFHIHTVFSDGLVWPTVRADEAWREGLDAIAITDHIEYQPHKRDVNTNHNRSYQLAQTRGDALDVLVIKGSEITHKMPPGHINAIFLTNSAPLAGKEWREEVKTAHEQGAFIFWNHPGWDAQLKDGKVVWYDEHTSLLEQGMLNGIEVVNGRDYYPEAHRWAIDKRLTMLSNSDIHMPLNMDYHVHDGDRRPITLVFATARTQEAIREALFARRTAVYSNDRLIGDAQFLKPIFDGSVSIAKTNVALKGKTATVVQVANNSDVTFDLERVSAVEGISTPGELRLAAGRTVLMELKSADANAKGERQISVKYRVKNLLVGPGEGLEIAIPLQVSFENE